MQILPSQIIKGLMTPDFVPAFNGLSGKSSDSFADLLQMNASSAQWTPPITVAQNLPEPPKAPATVSADRAQLADPDMPASRADDSLRNVKMTKEDYSAVKEKLQQAGVSQDKIDEMEHKVQSPEGLTWGQLMQSVHQNVLQQYVKPQQLDEADKASVSSLLQRVGFDPKQADELTGALANGGKAAAKAFNLIAAKLAQQESGQTITVSKDDMTALAKALKLSDDTKQKIAAQFAAGQSMELTPQAMRETFLNMAGEVSKNLDQAKKAMQSLRNALAPDMEKVAQRLGLDQQAKNAQVDATQVKPSDLLKTPQEQAADVKHSMSDSVVSEDKHRHPQHDTSAKETRKDDPRGGQHTDAKNDQKNDQKNDPKADAKATQDRAWSDFTAKIKVTGESQPSATNAFSLVQNAAGQLSQQGAGSATANAQTARPQAGQFLDQVNSGILKNLGQGVKQLTLELTPDNLGKLNVMLTVKGKEVQAVIKADNPQTEQALAENLHQLRQTLENQGLTVSKLEVRTGLAQDNSLSQQQQQQWQGADKHNLQQERRETLERLRTTNLLSGGGDVEDLAQRMQNGGVTVKNSQGGLNIIA